MADSGIGAVSIGIEPSARVGKVSSERQDWLWLWLFILTAWPRMVMKQEPSSACYQVFSLPLLPNLMVGLKIFDTIAHFYIEIKYRSATKLSD
jgi:hypothetical protein